jgi:hypothetical protein
MKTILIIFICALSLQLFSQKVTIKDEDDHVLIEINDEDTSGSITILPGPAPASVNHKLYNVNNRLFWRGTQLGTIYDGGGWRTEGGIIYPVDLLSRVGIGTANPIPEMMLAVHKDNEGTNTISPVAHFRTVGDGNSAGAIRLENAYGHHFNIGVTKDPTNSFAINYESNISQSSDILRITPEGRVGIGAGDPTRNLEVRGSTIQDVAITIRNLNTAGSERLYFGLPNSGDAGIKVYGSTTLGQTQGRYEFFNNRTAAYFYWTLNGFPKMKLDHEGDLGIGTINPLARTHILQNGGEDAFRIDDEIDDSSPFIVTDAGSVGLGLVSPQEKLDVLGAIKIHTTTNPFPQAGTVRWNPNTEDFEGFTGSEWKSFTEQNRWGVTYAIENQGYYLLSGDDHDRFGHSVDVSGDKAIVGANLVDAGLKTDQGRAYILEREGTNWDKKQDINPSDGDSDDGFGGDVSLSGNWAIIGAHKKDIGGNVDQGSAYIFHYNGSIWTEHTILSASDANADDFFGCSVSIYGNWAIVGALQKEGGGRAYLYFYNGVTWSQKHILFASDGGGVFDHFGSNVAINGDYAIIGAHGKGQAYIWHRYSGELWNEQDILAPSDGVSTDWFGISVAISDTWSAVGTSNKEVSNNEDQGQVYVFNRNGSVWSETSILTASDGSAGDYFGRNMDISRNYLVIGAAHKDVGSITAQGKAYIYNGSGSVWSEEGIIIASDGQLHDFFGSSVAISGDWIVVGATGKNIGSDEDQGKVYFFSR